MKTAKDLELLLLIKEHEKQKLQLKINQAISFINDISDKTDEQDPDFKAIIFIRTMLLTILEGEEDD